MTDIKSIHQLRAVLCETVSGLRECTIPPATAEAISNASGKIIASIRVELEYRRQRGEVPALEFMEAEK